MSLQSLLADLRSILPLAELKISGFARDRDNTPQEGLVATDLDVMDAAVAVLVNDTDYEEWIRIGEAMHAAYAVDPERGRAAFTNFCLRWTRASSKGLDAGDDADRAWDTFQSPHSVGVDYLLSLTPDPAGYRARMMGMDFDGGDPDPAGDWAGHPDFDPIVIAEREAAKAKIEGAGLMPTPWVYQDPRSLPQIVLAYGSHYIKSVLSATFAAGGVGKSSLSLVEAVSMAVGRDLLRDNVAIPRQRAWVWNGEDDMNLLAKRVAAIMMHHGIKASEVEGWLFLDSGVDMPLCLASGGRGQTKRNDKLLQALDAGIKARRIDVAIFDPFIAMHEVDEIDNTGLGVVVRGLSKICADNHIAMDIVHHVRKGARGQTEIDVDDGRGGKALLDKVRSARVLNRMTEAEAKQIDIDQPRRFFRVSNGKANLMPPPAERSDWYELASISLGNTPGVDLSVEGDAFEVGGDSLGVVLKWEYPSVAEHLTDDDVKAVQAGIKADGKWRESSQSKDWIGHLIAQVMKMDSSDKVMRGQISVFIKVWIKAGYLQIVEERDAKRELRKFIRVGAKVPH